MTRKVVAGMPPHLEERYEDLGPGHAVPHRTTDRRVSVTGSTVGPTASCGGKVGPGLPNQRP